MSQYLEESKRIRGIKNPHYNCAQGVLIPFAKRAGLDEDQAYALAANFGGGMKRGSVCGAVTGALMVLGLYGLSDAETVRAFYRSFQNNHDGMLECRDLLAASAKRGEEKSAHCDGLVFECVEAVEKILRENGKID